MASKTISGISGVLGELISPASLPTESPQSSQLEIERQEAKSHPAPHNQRHLVHAVPVLAGLLARLPDIGTRRRK